MSTKRLKVDSVAEGFLELLETRGIRYFFGGGAGTDFPPFIEAFAKREAQGRTDGLRPNGGYGEPVEDPGRLPAALERALRAVRVEKRQALLNVVARKG